MLTEQIEKLLAAGRPNDQLHPTPPVDALMQLLHFAEDGNALTSHQPWELSPAVCRRLEDGTGCTPPGGWSNLIGLSVGAGVFDVRRGLFVARVPSSQLPALIGDGSAAMVESFTRYLTPPAAAAALYVALDVHPLWGIELGRNVGVIDTHARPLVDATALPRVQDFVFGTLTGLLMSLRCLNSEHRYPVDQLAEVLFQAAQSARAMAGVERYSNGLPIFLENAPPQRRLLSTRIAAQDLLDYVFVPAGVCRRDDAGGFTVNCDAIAAVGVGDWDLNAQRGWWAAALALAHREA